MTIDSYSGVCLGHCTHSGSTVHTLVPLLLYFTLTLLWAITVFLSHFKRYWIYPELELSWCIHAETVDLRLRVSIWWQNNYKCITFCIALSKCTYTVVRTLHVHCICVCVCVCVDGRRDKTWVLLTLYLRWCTRRGSDNQPTFHLLYNMSAVDLTLWLTQIVYIDSAVMFRLWLPW